MLEPESFSKHLADSTDEYDLEYQDMMSHIDDLEWISYGDKNKLSGTVSGVQGSEDGWVHGGVSVYWEQV